MLRRRTLHTRRTEKDRCRRTSPDASERIIARLLKERFIDESRYTRFFVNDKLRFNKWGRVKIGYELYKKNIPSPIREESLAAIDEENTAPSYSIY